MISIKRAAEDDAQTIVDIGYHAAGDAHRESSPVDDLNSYLDKTYNDDAIKAEIRDQNNFYLVISVDEYPVGFSKMIMNSVHPNITATNVAKLDRIYLRKDYFGMKLGYKLLQFNIEMARQNQQSAIWLFTWIGNTRAIDFYRSAGFKVIGSHRFYVTKSYYNMNHQMLLQLDEV